MSRYGSSTCGANKGEGLPSRACEGHVLDDGRVSYVRERDISKLDGALCRHNILCIWLVLQDSRFRNGRIQAYLSLSVHPARSILDYKVCSV